MKKLLYIIMFLSGWVHAAHASDMLEIEVKKDREIIELHLPEGTKHKLFTVANPERLVIDISALSGKPTIALPNNYTGHLIKGVRLGRFDAATTRIVFDLNERIEVGRVHAQSDEMVELTIDIASAKPSAVGPVPAGAVAAKDKPQKTTKYATFKTPKTPKIPIIVIDAGHGGVDPGTTGPDGTQEKDVVLAYAQALRERLMKSARYQVILTRDHDEFIMLRGRVEIARKNNATIFISLHADSAPEMSAHGLSIYTVSEQASDAEAEALAARENKADVISGMDLSEERQDVADILISLAQRDTKNRSAVLADLLVRSLSDKVALLANAHRFAGFAVLKAPDIPSVLIEIGFLSHPKEEKLLLSKTYREKVIAGIAYGIDDYFRLDSKAKSK